MGVPAFYRWLSEKYPKIVVDMLEDRPVRVEGTEIPLDLTAENPNGIEVRTAPQFCVGHTPTTWETTLLQLTFFLFPGTSDSCMEAGATSTTTTAVGCGL